MSMPKQPDSLILRVTGHFLLPLLIMFSLFLLLVLIGFFAYLLQ